MEELGLNKICVIDNGIGMTPIQMVGYLNDLGHSSESKSKGYKNFGIGVKISAVTRNPVGIQYESWTKGEKGFSVFLQYDEDSDSYGLKEFDNFGSRILYNEIEEEVTPDLIKKSGHGTRVTFFGESEEQDTTRKSSHKIFYGSEAAWIFRILNSRFFKFSKDIEVKAIHQYDRNDEKLSRSYLESVKPLNKTLEEISIKNGSVSLSDFDMKWWILDKDRSMNNREIKTGHFAINFENEIFNLSNNSYRASDFGIKLGARNVVLHLSPHDNKGSSRFY